MYLEKPAVHVDEILRGSDFIVKRWGCLPMGRNLLFGGSLGRLVFRHRPADAVGIASSDVHLAPAGSGRGVCWDVVREMAHITCSHPPTQAPASVQQGSGGMAFGRKIRQQDSGTGGEPTRGGASHNLSSSLLTRRGSPCGIVSPAIGNEINLPVCGMLAAPLCVATAGPSLEDGFWTF